MFESSTLYGMFAFVYAYLVPFDCFLLLGALYAPGEGDIFEEKKTKRRTEAI